MLCLLSAAGLIWFYSRIPVAAPSAPAVASTRPVHPPAEPLITVEPEPAETVAPAAEANPPARSGWSRIFFRWTNTDQRYGNLAFVERDALDAPVFVDGLSCEVVHFAANTGVCLQADRGVITRYSAVLFDSAFRPAHKIPLNGIPSRARVSPDGRLAAVTVFLSGHSYASVDFTTKTLLIDTANGEVLANLEDFQMSRDGSPFSRADFNYWGVSFAANSRRLYCTLSSNRQHYLVEADWQTRQGRVIHDNVECPSLSPDGKWIAYKKRVPGDRVRWQLHVLNLASGKETALPEERNVDDQLEWLDNSHVLYALPESQTTASARMDVWVADTNSGAIAPRKMLAWAYSPAVVRARR